MFRNGTAANKYSFTGYFGAGNFKLISTKAGIQLGKASATAIELVMLVNYNATAGYYKFTFDTTTLTYISILVQQLQLTLQLVL
jgi:hypothetical protein